MLCAFWQFEYGDKQRGLGIEYESFIPALRRLGHEVKHFETWDQSLYPTYSDLNHALLNEINSFRPDIVFTVQRDYEIWTETLRAIQQHSNAALVTWTTDDSFKFPRVSRFIGRNYDAISTTYSYRVADYQSEGIEGVYLTQWAANSHWLNPPKAAKDCKYAVSFIGACYGQRAETMKNLEACGIHVDCFGYGWPNGSIPTHTIPVIMRDSVISLNFSAGFMSDAGNDKQIKARTFEVPGAGGFLLTDQAPGLDALYKIGEEVEVYEGMEGLEGKIKHYLLHPEQRDRVAQAGYSRTAACHTYEQRLAGLLDFALQRKRARSQPSAGADLGIPDNILPKPSLGLFLRCARFSLVQICSLIWGRKRGIKAARRLVFEISYRLFGARSFAAMSLPGRMFPYV